MKFLEIHHAYISAFYYKVLKQKNLLNYRNVFVLATQRTAEERGTRMALRALKDGVEELDYQAYRHYGEWVFTKEYLMTIEGQEHIVPIESGTDFAYVVHTCPWADAYRELNLSEDGGVDYCKNLDASIVRGFNPDLEFRLDCTLNESDRCVQYQIGGVLDSSNKVGDKKPENTKDFSYQCGHIYNTFSRIITSVYDIQGDQVNQEVIEHFRLKFGDSMADEVLSYKSTDFLMI